jgi:NitT/TauT family transport system substrate-binding protein
LRAAAAWGRKQMLDVERDRLSRGARKLALGTFLLTLGALALGMSSLAAQTSLKLSLNGQLGGAVAPFLIAADKDYYHAEGLYMTIDPGAGPFDTASRLATGNFDVAFGDINALIRLRDQNPTASLKAIFMVYNRPAYAIIGRKSRGVARPKDLEDRKLGAPATDPGYAQWPLFAQLNDIDAAKVALLNVGVPVREPMLASGEVDAIIGNTFISYVNLKERGVPTDDIDVMLMADYGLELYGGAILVNGKFASENPEAVRGFLRAFLKGLKDTIKNPAAAVESVLKRSEGARKEIELERLRIVLRDNVVTPEVKAQGFGGVDPTRFEHAIDQIALAYKFKTKPKVEDVFDASFLPPLADRKWAK